MAGDSLRVQRSYLWALEVLACDTLDRENQTRAEYPDRYEKAQRIIDAANTNRPLARKGGEH